MDPAPTTRVVSGAGPGGSVAPGPIGVHTRAAEGDLRARVLTAAEAMGLPLAGIGVSFALFGIFVGIAGANVPDVYYQMYRGAFGSGFSFQNTLVRAAPLMLTALCTAMPAQLGLVIIGGEGALVLGALAATIAAHALDGANAWVVLSSMALAGATVGGGWVALQGALRALRGVNETISSLLLNYIAIGIFKHLVEGPMRDPASLNKPSTRPIGEANALGAIPGTDVHWGLVYGVVACVAAYVLMRRTVFGFAAKVIGGNARAAQVSGLAVPAIVVVTCALAGAAAGVAGMVEVAAVHGTANASLIVGYGYTGILVAFLARQHPLGILPVAVLIGGIGASGGLLQRTEHLPDATVNVLQGILFIVILAGETLRGRFGALAPRAIGVPQSVRAEAKRAA
ncbi:MAG TPA: ABC transporter permease [Polyangiaceae bacterium]|nr:ABC transporter permease [Polyangiaceae bacterium]